MSRRPYVTPPRHLQPSRNMSAPEPGFFRMRLTKGGPMVAARIRHEPTRDPVTNEPLERSWFWRAEVNGSAIDARPSPSPTEWVERIWTSGERISEAEYYDLLDAQFEPDAPEPNERMRLASAKPLF